MAAVTAGEADLFKENFDNAVKNIVMQKLLLKQNLCTVQRSTAAEEHFYQESVYDLNGGSGTLLPKGASFPADQVKWTKVTVRPQKFGLESRYDWEDSIISTIDIPARTTMRIANSVAKAIDTRVWNVVTENVTPTTIKTVATTNPWNDTTRANRLPHEDIARAIRAISDSSFQAYEPDTIVVSPLDSWQNAFC